MSKIEHDWFTKRAPICSCFNKTKMQVIKDHYWCPSCMKEVTLLAAGTELSKLSNKDKHRIKYV